MDAAVLHAGGRPSAAGHAKGRPRTPKTHARRGAATAAAAGDDRPAPPAGRRHPTRDGRAAAVGWRRDGTGAGGVGGAAARCLWIQASRHGRAPGAHRARRGCWGRPCARCGGPTRESWGGGGLGLVSNFTSLLVKLGPEPGGSYLESSRGRPRGATAGGPGVVAEGRDSPRLDHRRRCGGRPRSPPAQHHSLALLLVGAVRIPPADALRRTRRGPGADPSKRTGGTCRCASRAPRAARRDRVRRCARAARVRPRGLPRPARRGCVAWLSGGAARGDAVSAWLSWSYGAWAVGHPLLGER